MTRKVNHAAASIRTRLPRAAAPTPGSLNVNQCQHAQEAAARERIVEEAKEKKETKVSRTRRSSVRSERKGQKISKHKKENKSRPQNEKKIGATKLKKNVLSNTKGGRVSKTKGNKKVLVTERGQISRRLTRSDRPSSPDLVESPMSTRRRKSETRASLPEPSEAKNEAKIDEDKIKTGKARHIMRVKGYHISKTGLVKTAERLRRTAQ